MKNLLATLAVVGTVLTGGIASAATVIIVAGGTTPAPSNKISTASIPGNAFVTSNEILTVGDTAEFTYTALKKMTVSDIALSGTSSQSGDNMAKIVFGINSTPTTNFSSITSNAGSGSGQGSLPGLSLLAGESFTIFWATTSDIIGTAGITASFSTSAVPVPAALPLLAGGIAALGVAGRKKKRS